ncbi:MAG: hypothetical protein WD077_11505 [Bacteroidia bacterium]
MDNNAKIKVNLNTREFEIEGSEEFINSHSHKIDYFLHFLKNLPPHFREALKRDGGKNLSAALAALSEGEEIENQNVLDNLPDSFAGFYEQMPPNAKDVDKMLGAAYYIQARGDKNIFTTREASKTLKTLGVRLSNPSNAVKLNMDAEKMTQNGKRIYQVTDKGIEHLRSIMYGSRNR